jgi:HAD superfamily hydrolase (TIGR01484 family)
MKTTFESFIVFFQGENEYTEDMKLFASDFDGTLYRHNEITAADQQAIAAFQKHHAFAVSTGRSLTGIDFAVQGVIRFDYYILASGALILNAEKDPIFIRTIDRPLIKQIYQRWNDLPMVFHAKDTVFTLDAPLPMQKHVDHLSQLPDQIYGLSIAAPNEAAAKQIVHFINEQYGEVMHAFQNRTHIDAAPAGCSKGNAIRILKQAGFSSCEAIGDSYNDIPMLAAADVAYTFPHAPAFVQKNADRIVESVACALSYSL